MLYTEKEIKSILTSLRRDGTLPSGVSSIVNVTPDLSADGCEPSLRSRGQVAAPVVSSAETVTRGRPHRVAPTTDQGSLLRICSSQSATPPSVQPPFRIDCTLLLLTLSLIICIEPRKAFMSALP